MRYMGGKTRIAKALREVVLADADRPRTRYVEPFVGGASALVEFAPHFAEVFAGDVVPDLVLLWKALQLGWEPPTEVSEGTYEDLRHQSPSALRAFVGYGCSFAAKWFGGYARGAGRNFAREARDSCLKKAAKFLDVHFVHQSYEAWDPWVTADTVVYCDPPYADTTGYTGAGAFDHSQFWRVVQNWAARGAAVYVSEYTAPEGAAQCIWSKEIGSTVARNNQGHRAVERLFRVLPPASVQAPKSPARIPTQAAHTTTTRLGHYSSHGVEDPTVRTYAIGDDARRMVVDMAKRAPYVAVDIETDGLASESYTVKVIIIATAEHACVLNGFDPQHVEAARDAIATAQVLLFHNSEFDVPPLVHSGAMTLDDIAKVVDTLILARMAFTDAIAGRKLEYLEKLLLKTVSGKVHKDRFKTWAKINRMSIKEAFKKVSYSDPVYTMYAGWDGIVTSRILQPLMAAAMKQLTSHPFGRYGADAAQASYLIAREQRVNRVMLRRSAKGLRVDDERLEAEQQRLIELQSDLESRLREFGIESATNPGQLVTALVKADAIPDDYPRTAKTQRPSTAGENLEKLDHPAAQAYIAYGDNNRLMNYLGTAQAIAARTDGRLHPTVGIMKAVTGRMSYGLPALQQFTPSAREMILFDDGDEGVSIDWSQIEPVITANLANDHRALEVYESGPGGDLYQVAADAGQVTRKHAKVVVLAMLYQQQLRSLARSLGTDMQEASVVRSQVADALTLTNRFCGWATEWSKVVGKTWTLSGRIVDVDPAFGYKGANYTVQGSSYDLLAETIVGIDDLGASDQFYLALHDEVVVSSSVAHEVAQLMRTPHPRLVELSNRVPVLRVDASPLGSRWRTICDKTGQPVTSCAHCH